MYIQASIHIYIYLFRYVYVSFYTNGSILYATLHLVFFSPPPIIIYPGDPSIFSIKRAVSFLSIAVKYSIVWLSFLLFC